jgi:hypothetical protein
MESNALQGLNLIELQSGQSYVLTIAGDDGDTTPNAAIGDLDITDGVVIESSFSRRYRCDTKVDRVLDPIMSSSGRIYLNRSSVDGTIARIDGNRIDRIFDVYPGSGPNSNEVHLDCLHITGGTRIDKLSAKGGGIRNAGTLVLTRTIVSQNTLTGDNAAGVGIFNSGQLVLSESALMNNDGGTFGAVFGGAAGGGLYNYRTGTALISQSLIALNRAARAPGLISDRAGTVMINNSTIAMNLHGDDDAAGVLGSSIINYGALQIHRSTVLERNRQLFNSDFVGEAPMMLNDGTASISNSLLIGGNSPTGAPGCTRTGTTTSLGGNWVGLGTCLGFRGDARDRILSLVEFEARLEDPQLADHGGFTPTIATRATRHGGDASATPFVDPDPAIIGLLPRCPATDQRGFRRPADGNGDGVARCDPGAFELGASR